MRIPFFKLLVSAMLLSATMSSCIVYHAPTTSLPLLAEKGEKQLEASLSASAPLGLAPALNVSFAYAPTDLLCTQAAVSFTNEKAFQAQLQAGIYKNFQPAVLEWYVGYAYGTSYSGKSSDLNKNNYYYDGYYQIPFTQLNFGFRKLLHGFVAFLMQKRRISDVIISHNCTPHLGTLEATMPRTLFERMSFGRRHGLGSSVWSPHLCGP